jgi:hypothetical protein
MRFHILVTPIANESAILTREQAEAGLAWLHAKLADGTLTAAEAWPQTGGYMIAEVSSLDALNDLLATYPLRHTVILEVNVAIPLDDGFAVLFAAIDIHAKRMAEQSPPAPTFGDVVSEFSRAGAIPRRRRS